MDILFELDMFQMPNFLLIKIPPGRREDGIIKLPSIPVGQLNQLQANEYAEEMKKAFIAHWEKKSILYKKENNANQH